MFKKKKAPTPVALTEVQDEKAKVREEFTILRASLRESREKIEAAFKRLQEKAKEVNDVTTADYQ